jgi:hypothetical protein
MFQGMFDFKIIFLSFIQINYVIFQNFIRAYIYYFESKQTKV